MKKCKRCKLEKTVIKFYSVKSFYPKDGLSSWCKSCIIKYNKKYKKQKRVYMKVYRIKNPDKLKDWKARNKDKVKQHDRTNYIRHKKRYRLSARKRKLKLRNLELRHTEDEWNDLKYAYNYQCFICGKNEPEIHLTRDHIIPLSKEGQDNIENIIPLCQPCNSKKGTKEEDYYLIAWKDQLLKKQCESGG